MAATQGQRAGPGSRKLTAGASRPAGPRETYAQY